MATSTTTNPTIIIVPGAWHRQIHVQPLMDALEARHYRTKCIELATVLTNEPRPTWDNEVFWLTFHVEQELNAGRDVTLFLHSYAGLPGTEAINRLIQTGALLPGVNQGRLRHVTFFAAHHFPKGVVADVKGFVGPANPSFYIDESTNMSIHNKPFEDFFTDMASKDEAQPYVDEIKPMYYIPGGGSIATDEWLEVPRTIVGTQKDKAIVPEMQKQMWAEFAGEMVWIETGHTPFMVKPELVADVVIEGLQKGMR